MNKSLACMIICCAGFFLINTSPSLAQSSRPGVGAIPYVSGGVHGVTFRVWAPNATNVAVAGSFNGWNMTSNPLVKESDGYWSTDVSPVDVGAQYKYVINNTLWRKDPRSLKVVNSSGESVVFDPDAYQWDIETFIPPERKDMVVYAMHVLTYNPGFTLSPYGNFGMAISKLDHLQAMGVNVVELMPIAEFPGNNSWGYNPTDITTVPKIAQ